MYFHWACLQERRDFIHLISTAHKDAENKGEGSSAESAKSRTAFCHLYWYFLGLKEHPVQQDGFLNPFSALARDEIKAQALLFFIAGYDTTANALCWLIYSLACNPETQEVFAEIQEFMGGEVGLLTRWNIILFFDLSRARHSGTNN